MHLRSSRKGGPRPRLKAVKLSDIPPLVVHVLASSLRFLQPDIMAAQHHAVRASYCSSRYFYSEVASCKNKAVTRAMPVLSDSLKSSQFSMAPSFSSPCARSPQSVFPQWRITSELSLAPVLIDILRLEFDRGIRVCSFLDIDVWLDSCRTLLLCAFGVVK